MPFHPTHKTVGYTYLVHRKHRDADPTGPKRTGASGILVTTEHSGTHIDALCHQAVDRKLYSGIEINSNVETPYGFSVLGIETVPPLVARGLLLDIAGFYGGRLERERSITAEELNECCKSQKVLPRKGDVLLVRTGFGQLWGDEKSYLEAAGVSIEGAEWLSSFGISAAGADNMSFEVDDGKIDPKRNVTLPCHALLLVEKGIYIMENLNLERLASEKIYESLFVCTPLKLNGATGSPVRPIAISGVSIPNFS